MVTLSINEGSSGEPKEKKVSFRAEGGLKTITSIQPQRVAPFENDIAERVLNDKPKPWDVSRISRRE